MLLLIQLSDEILFNHLINYLTIIYILLNYII